MTTQEWIRVTHATFLLSELLRDEEEEDEEEQSDAGPPPGLPPRGSFSQDATHPYYDVARHGILQVTGERQPAAARYANFP